MQHLFLLAEGSWALADFDLLSVEALRCCFIWVTKPTFRNGLEPMYRCKQLGEIQLLARPKAWEQKLIGW